MHADNMFNFSKRKKEFVERKTPLDGQNVSQRNDNADKCVIVIS